MDADGLDDFVVSSYDGFTYVVGGTQGGWARPVRLTDAEGAELHTGMWWSLQKKRWSMQGEHTTAATLADWDGDGDQDLVVGTRGGHIQLRLNGGTPKAWAFETESAHVDDAQGEPLLVAGKYATPVCVDWDGDGVLDIISGSGAGGVTWFRGFSVKGGARRFGAERVLIPGPASGEASGQQGGGFAGVLTRTSLWVADLNGDGRLDLLVGGITEAAEGSEHRYSAPVLRYIQVKR